MIGHILRQSQDNDINVVWTWAPGREKKERKTKDHVRRAVEREKEGSRMEVMGRARAIASNKDRW